MVILPLPLSLISIAKGISPETMNIKTDILSIFPDCAWFLSHFFSKYFIRKAVAQIISLWYRLDQMNEKPYDTTTISFSDHHATLQTMCSFPCRDVNKMSKCHFCDVCQSHKQIIWIDFQHYHRKMFHHYFPWVLFIGLTGHSSSIDQIWHSLPWNRMC